MWEIIFPNLLSQMLLRYNDTISMTLLRKQKMIMPTDLIHRIGFAAPAEKIYRAITTEEEMI